MPNTVKALLNEPVIVVSIATAKYTSVEAIDPVSGQMVPLYHPRQDQWEEHFGWNEDFSLIVGLTATGRATIEKLQINREGVVNSRRVLHFVDEHPPGTKW